MYTVFFSCFFLSSFFFGGDMEIMLQPENDNEMQNFNKTVNIGSPAIPRLYVHTTQIFSFGYFKKIKISWGGHYVNSQT